MPTRITKADVSGSIDGELSSAMSDNTTVLIEPGDYDWNGDAVGGSYSNLTVKGDGGMVYLHQNGDYHNTTTATNGTVRFENITIKGRGDSGKNRWRLQADSGATVKMVNVHLPDGARGFGEHPSPIGFYVASDHSGHITFFRCSVQNMPNNGIYGETKNGTMHIDQCYLKGNDIDNIRVSEGDKVTNTVIVQDDGGQSGFRTGRGLRVRYKGSSPASFENVHITNINCSRCVVLAKGKATLKDVYVRNETGGSALAYDHNVASAQNVHVSGSGDTDFGGYATHKGSNAKKPRTDPPWTWDSLSDDMPTPDGGSSGGGSGGGGSDTPDKEKYPNLLVIDGGGEEAAYHLKVSGELTTTTEGGGTWNDHDSKSNTFAEGFVYGGEDAYRFSGELESFFMEDGPVARLNGEVIASADYPDETGGGNGGDGGSGGDGGNGGDGDKSHSHDKLKQRVSDLEDKVSKLEEFESKMKTEVNEFGNSLGEN